MTEAWTDQDPLGFHPALLTETPKRFVDKSPLPAALDAKFPSAGWLTVRKISDQQLFNYVHGLVATKYCDHIYEKPRWLRGLSPINSENVAYNAALHRRCSIEVITELTGETRVQFGAHNLIRTMVQQQLCDVKAPCKPQ
jgi:hypothetical protein